MGDPWVLGGLAVVSAILLRKFWRLLLPDHGASAVSDGGTALLFAMALWLLHGLTHAGVRLAASESWWAGAHVLTGAQALLFWWLASRFDRRAGTGSGGGSPPMRHRLSMRVVLLALLVWLLVQPLARLLVVLPLAIAGASAEEAPRQPTLDAFLDAWALGNWHVVLGIAVPVVVLVPLLEEVIFRRLLLGGLEALLVSRRGRARAQVLAVVLGALLFALAHHGFTFLPVFFLGLVLGTIWVRTRSLLLVIGLHALHNATTLLEWAWLSRPA